MRYNIIREPYILLETVGMLHKYVNDIKAVDTVKYRFPPADDAERQSRVRCMQRMNRVQEIINEVCVDVDRNDPQMVRYFGRVECGCEYTCLAQLLTFSFCTLERSDFWGNVEDICRIWKDLQERNCWIDSKSAVSLLFSDEPESPGNLIRQVKVLNYSGEFRMELCDALDSFEDTLHHMAELIEPLAQRLEKVFREDPFLFGDLWNYWQDVICSGKNAPILELMGADAAVLGEVTEVRIALSCMNTNLGSNLGGSNTALRLNYRALFLGSSVTPESTTIRKGVEWDGISALLKCLGDSKRLEMLRRLAKERSYGLALAEAMGIDQGNVSRNLGMLYNCGMLKQEREVHRTYYQTDSEALHDFFVRVEQLIHS